MPESSAVARARTVPDLARILFLVIAMTIWADVNDWLAAHYHLGRIALNLLRTVVDCGGVLWLGCMVWGGRSLRELGWRTSRPGALVLVGLAQTALTIAAIFAVVALFFGASAARELGGDVRSTSLGQHVWFGVLGAKIAVWEETLFRGDLLPALESRLGPWAALFASSAIFALYHLHLADLSEGVHAVFNVGMLLKFTMGAIFAASAIRMRSLVPGAIAHALLWTIMCDN